MSSSKSENSLIIFVKYPEKGKVKTRLAKTVGETEAAEIYSIVAKYIIDKFSNSDFYNTSVYYSPPEKEKEVTDWLLNASVKFFPQRGNNLGEKISNAFENCFKKGAKNIVIVGTDCIEITSQDINQTFNTLGGNNSQIVIGPANDGGYYLLGLNTFKKELFESIDWSTEKVLPQTIEKIKKNKLNYNLIHELSDIDEIEDIDLDSLRKINLDVAKKIDAILKNSQLIEGVI